MRKAIICHSLEGTGPKITLLGHGGNESAARRAAYQNTNHGHNLYEDEFTGGELVDMAPELVDALEGENYQWAAGTLFLDGKILRAKHYTPDPVWVEKIEKEQAENARLSEVRSRRIKAVTAIGEAQAQAVAVAIDDNDRGALLDIAATAATLEPLRLIFSYLDTVKDTELSALAEARWADPSPHVTREFFKAQDARYPRCV